MPIFIIIEAYLTKQEEDVIMEQIKLEFGSLKLDFVGELLSENDEHDVQIKVYKIEGTGNLNIVTYQGKSTVYFSE